MKKLIIVAAMAIASAVANAASVNWTIDYSYIGGTSDYAEGYVAFFFDNAVFSLDDAHGKIAANDLSFVATYGHAASDVADDEGYFDGAVSGYGNGVEVTGYVLLLDADVANATVAFLSGTESDSTKGSGLPANIEFGDLTATQTASNWTTLGGEVIPEPSSALLLLLGMAGIALRRKQA